MKLNNNIKQQTLYKIDRLIRDIIVGIYLEVIGDQRTEKIKTMVGRLLKFAQHINDDIELNVYELTYIEDQYQQYIGGDIIFNNIKTEFNFK